MNGNVLTAESNVTMQKINKNRVTLYNQWTVEILKM